MNVRITDLDGVCHVGTTGYECLETQNDEVKDDETAEHCESITAKEFNQKYGSEEEPSSTRDPSDGDDLCICEECEGDVALVCSVNPNVKDPPQESDTLSRGGVYTDWCM